jgi:hypothetical protein
MHTNYFDSVLAPQPNTLVSTVKNDDQDENEWGKEEFGPHETR